MQADILCVNSFGSVHTVVIDCAPISFVDAVGVKALKQLVLDFDECGVQVLFAAMSSKYTVCVIL